ncbi:hypothetical protein BECAL_00519 [Bellilinea caldifistulae]|uniref:Phage portal protein n=1 Tax=Bellilinea caldifistulae TaxID=360411 RepID=A0A0N8GMG5_9CHLR|nr:hypothetical protein [Bellilinea caldifistulae]KPL75234.1 hypothetical protein AC812_09755 [Bellilinea caldifistulae]GAP09376.1 hypothetical protein BECAL_00519 [Bellilinea caldifistulae]
MKETFWQGLRRRLLADEVRLQVRAALQTETDNTFTLGARSASAPPHERPFAERREALQQALEAWRVNPLARRIVELTTQYVVGGGITFACEHPATSRFLHQLWHHPLNQLSLRLPEWCDELTRSGNLFILISTDPAGMSYFRAVPAAQIDEIRTRPNDVDQPLEYQPVPGLDGREVQAWPAYQPLEDGPDAGGRFPAVMRHYAINRPAGCVWGESDLLPLLRWLSRYANWLEDRARLNRYRTAFLYVVRSRFTGEGERLARQQRLNAQPPAPGSILVTDENETWEVIQPRLEADDANTDGLAIKKMIAAGAGLPLHFLAEPESSTRTTAEAAGGPTYRRFEQRQAFFLQVIADLLRIAVQRRALAQGRRPGGGRVDGQAVIRVHGGDLSARDNVALGLAGNHILAVVGQLRDRGLIDDRELLRVVYRFIGETAEVEELLEGGKAALPAGPAGRQRGGFPEGKVDLTSGEPKNGGLE